MTKVVQQSADPTWGSLCDAYFSSYSNPLKKGDLDFGLCGSYLYPNSAWGSGGAA